MVARTLSWYAYLCLELHRAPFYFTQYFQGNNYPFRGAKGSFYNGGVRAVGLVHSPRIPYSIRGQSYNGLLHITDW